MTVTAISSAQSLVVVDLGVGLGGALAAVHFADLGARVLRLQPENGDPFYVVYPAYRSLHAGVQIVDKAAIEEALAGADICILGGESYPGVEQPLSARDIHARHPRLVILELSGGKDQEGRERPAVDLLAQARSGLCFDQFSDRPLAWPLPMPTFAMVVQGLIATWAALLVRERSQRGQIVTSSMQGGAAAISTPDRVSFERPTPLTERNVPADVRQLILRCADGRYIQFTKLPGGLANIYRALGIPITGDPATLETREVATDPRDFFGNYDLFSTYAANFQSQDLLEALWAADIPADAVLAPGECWNDPQVVANGTIRERIEGVRSVGLPIRFAASAEAGGANRPDRASHPGGGPLEGYKVLGLGAYIAGPYATRALADLGADVIKLDAIAGDPSVNTYGHWWACNMGKRSVRLNLKTPEGLALLHKMSDLADAVLHNFRPGVAKRLGIDPAALRARGAAAVTLECSAYGSSGPKADFPGFDQIAMGISGQEVRAGGVGNPPLWYRNCVADYTTGMLGSLAVLVGLFERQRSGAIVQAEANLLDSALYLLSELVQDGDGTFRGAPLNGPERLGSATFERIYRAADGWVALAARGEAMQRRFLEAIGVPGETAGLEDAIRDRLRSLSTAELLSLCAAADVWAEACACYRGVGIDADPAAVQAGLVRTFNDPELGEVVSPGAVVGFSESRSAGSGRAPHPGEHTREVLAELGCSGEVIDDYFARGVAA